MEIFVEKRPFKDKKPRKTGLTMESEHCTNPWNPKCRNTDIKVYIRYNGKIHAICSECWENIIKRKIEWGDGSK